MANYFKRLFKKEVEDWQDFFAIIGLKTTLQQIVVGMAMGIIIMMILGVGEWVHDLIFH